MDAARQDQQNQMASRGDLSMTIYFDDFGRPLVSAYTGDASRIEEVLQEMGDTDFFFNIRNGLLPSQAVIRANRAADLAREARRADRRADALYTHRATRDAIEAGFVAALQEWKAEDPAGHERFDHHAQSAARASSSTVRCIHIMQWYRRVPARVRSALIAMSQYYVKEVGYLFKLADAEGYPQGYDHLGEEDLYAAQRRGKAIFGFETGLHPFGSQMFIAHKPHPLALENYLANLKVRFIRLDQAKLSDRCGAKPYAESLDRKIVIWLEEAMEHLYTLLPLSRPTLVIDNHASMLRWQYLLIHTPLYRAETLENAFIHLGEDIPKIIQSLTKYIDKDYQLLIWKTFKMETREHMSLFCKVQLNLRRVAFEIKKRAAHMQHLRDLRIAKAEKEHELRACPDDQQDRKDQLAVQWRQIAVDHHNVWLGAIKDLGDAKGWDWEL